jgi:predicted 3-demethylubiquinone-9 3-methyltransferase (glyoxalase superfamily)
MQKIRPFLWYDGRAQEAAQHYREVFAESGSVEVAPDGPGGSITIGGLEIILFDGGPGYEFNEAISLMVTCADQSEIDRLWDALVDGGEPSRCGWLKDRFGVSWQIVPESLGGLLGDPDPKRAQAALSAMLSMSKLDLAALEAAAGSA